MYNEELELCFEKYTRRVLCNRQEHSITAFVPAHSAINLCLSVILSFNPSVVSICSFIYISSFFVGCPMCLRDLSSLTRDSVLSVHWKDWWWSWHSNTLATWCEELIHWKRSWCRERLRAGGEGEARGWDGWMASPTQWTWVWVGSGSWWWTGKPGMLQSMGWQELDTTERLNWTNNLSTFLNYLEHNNLIFSWEVRIDILDIDILLLV